MKILIVDDEQPARERLKDLLSRLPDHQLCGEAASGSEALQIIREQQPDVVLLDIRMPQMDGLEVARMVADFALPPAVIFTTAYDEHAIQAFDTQAVSYLLKPIRTEHLLKALNSAQTINRAQLAGLQRGRAAGDRRRTHLNVKLGNRLELIALTDVFYFRAEQKYVVVRHSNGEAVIEESLKMLEDEFADGFLRIHRNALITLAKVSGMKKNEQGRYESMFNRIADRLEVSRRHLAAVRKRIRLL
jgi:two-component system response regulator AlgR